MQKVTYMISSCLKILPLWEALPEPHRAFYCPNESKPAWLPLVQGRETSYQDNQSPFWPRCMLPQRNTQNLRRKVKNNEEQQRVLQHKITLLFQVCNSHLFTQHVMCNMWLSHICNNRVNALWRMNQQESVQTEIHLKNEKLK